MPCNFTSKKLFHWFLSRILLNFQVIAYDRHIRDWKITYYIEHLLMVSLFGFKRILGVDRSNRQEVFCKKRVLKNFEKFTGKHLHGSLFFDNKVVACKPETLSKKELRHYLFSFGFCKIFKEHLSHITSANGCFCTDWKHFWFPQKFFTFLFFTKVETWLFWIILRWM